MATHQQFTRWNATTGQWGYEPIEGLPNLQQVAMIKANCKYLQERVEELERLYTLEQRKTKELRLLCNNLEDYNHELLMDVNEAQFTHDQLVNKYYLHERKYNGLNQHLHTVNGGLRTVSRTDSSSDETTD